ncbi:hypothetical protein [[Anoxybacillus] calidus]
MTKRVISDSPPLPTTADKNISAKPTIIADAATSASGSCKRLKKD